MIIKGYSNNYHSVSLPLVGLTPIVVVVSAPAAGADPASAVPRGVIVIRHLVHRGFMCLYCFSFTNNTLLFCPRFRLCEPTTPIFSTADFTETYNFHKQEVHLPLISPLTITETFFNERLIQYHWVISDYSRHRLMSPLRASHLWAY